ncbi:MAG: universal stress protein, partial [Bacteroidota bacterium]
MSQNNILIPIDFSEQSHIALGQSYNLAKFTGSTITLLHIAVGSEPDAQNKLDKLAQEVSTQSGLQVNTMIVKGKIHEQIIKTAEKINAIVIVLGFKSLKGVMKLLERSACPVITIKGKDHHNGCKNIVLPLDMTEATREKVSKAIEFAKFFNSTIHIISVRLHTHKRHEKKMIAYSHQVQKFIKEKGIPCTIITKEGKDIAQLILDYAHEIKADLI